MKEKVSVQFTLSELSYVLNSLSLHEFNRDDEDYTNDVEHSKFISDLTLKMVKRYESSGYTNELVRIAKKNATYIKSLIK